VSITRNSCKILVLGASGMAGSTISQYLTKIGYAITAWTRKEFNALVEPPLLLKYDYVINCIGLIKQKSSDDNLFFRLNDDFPHKLVPKCKKLFHISSDCVFSGNLAAGKSYCINDVKDAEDSYGKSKAKGEDDLNAMILRTSIIGPSKDNFGLFEWFRHTSQNPVKGFVNHWWSGITTLELAKIIDNIIHASTYQIGIKQIASESISKFSLLQLINEIFECQKSIISHTDTNSVNRTLMPDIQSLPLRIQLYELKEFMNEASQNIHYPLQ